MSITIANQTPVLIPSSGGTTKTVTIPAPTAGNTLVLLARFDGSASITAVSGSGATWSQVATANSGAQVEMWLGVNCGTSTTISVTFNAGYIGSVDLTVVEVSGMPATATLDPATPGTNTGRSATATTSALTPTTGHALILFVVAGTDSTLTNSPSGSFVALTKAAGNSSKVAWAYQIVSSASGSYSTTFPDTPSYAFWATIIAGFDGASGGGPTESLFRQNPLTGLGSGGPFFANPIG